MNRREALVACGALALGACGKPPPPPPPPKAPAEVPAGKTRVEVDRLAMEIERVPPRIGFIAVKGVIDAKTVIVFQRETEKLKPDAKHFVFDMEHVTYVNSTAFGYLINLSDSATQAGGTVVLVKVQKRVRTVIDMLGLQAFFALVETREEALKACG